MSRALCTSTVASPKKNYVVIGGCFVVALGSFVGAMGLGDVASNGNVSKAAAANLAAMDMKDSVSAMSEEEDE